jgi:hypothetical protein
VFKIACTACGFPGCFVLHSLRHGGAVGAYLAGVSVDSIMLMGRWASLKSVKVCLQLGRRCLRRRCFRHKRWQSLAPPTSTCPAWFLLFALRVSMNRGCGLLFVLGGCVDYWWIGTTRASDSAVPSRCMVPACATRRIRVCKGRSAICGRSPLFRLRPVVYYFIFQCVGQTKT